MSTVAPIATIRKNTKEDVRIALEPFKGHDLFHIRVFADVAGASERRPTKKGLSLKVEMLSELIAALKAVEAAVLARDRALARSSPMPNPDATKLAPLSPAERARRYRLRVRERDACVTDGVTPVTSVTEA